MSETVVLPKVSSAGKAAPAERAPLIGIALASFAALLLELALTRLFSVVLFYHFAFLAISIALLGLGAGGVYAFLRRARLSTTSARRLAARLCLFNAIATLVALEVVLHVPVSLSLSGHNFKRLTLMYVFAGIPFFLTGIIFSVVFAREAKRIPQLYGADLLGGAVACLMVVPLLNWIGGPNAILFAGITMAVAGAIWAVSSRVRNLAFVIAAVFVVIIAANHNGRLIDVIYAKGIRITDYSSVEYVRWNAISRIEVDKKYSDGSRWAVIDADANTALVNVDLQHWQGSQWQKDLMSSPPSVANILRPRGDFAIIGPGGGVDVLRAVANGSPDVTGIEINPIIINRVMLGRYADYTYHLYQLPQVHIHVADGRSFIRSTKQQFDVVQMTLVDTWASTAAGAFALSENNLYTVQAFREYFSHLKPDGMIAITRWEFKRPREALRVVSVGMQALHEMGISNPGAHFMVISKGRLDEDGIAVLVLAKKSPFTSEEENAVRAHLNETDLVAQFMPSAPVDNAFGRLIASNDPYGFAKSYEFNVSPVTDDAPFFFFTLKIEQILNRNVLHRGIDWKVNLGVVVLGLVLIISILAVLAFLVLPMALHGGTDGHGMQLLYFIAIGLGYILVEIAFIQRFVLFLGHPTYALTVVIFLLLLSSGAGSMASRSWLSEPVRVRTTLAIIAMALLVYVPLLPMILSALIGLPFLVKLLISALLLAPLGFAMGMPFPTGLRWLAGNNVEAEDSTVAPVEPSNSKEGNAVEWAWAMNAASSVLGSVLAMVIAIQFGLNLTLACGSVAYLFALAVTSAFARAKVTTKA